MASTWALLLNLTQADTGDSGTCATPIPTGVLSDGVCLADLEACCGDGCWDIDEVRANGWTAYECAPGSDASFAYQRHSSEIYNDYWFDGEGQVVGVYIYNRDFCCQGTVVSSMVCGQPERSCLVPLILETEDDTSPGDAHCPTVEVAEPEPPSTGCATGALGALLAPALLAPLALPVRRRSW